MLLHPPHDTAPSMASCSPPPGPQPGTQPLHTPLGASSPWQPQLLQTGGHWWLWDAAGTSKPSIHPSSYLPACLSPIPPVWSPFQPPFFLPAIFTTTTLSKRPILKCNLTIRHLPGSAGSSKSAQSFPQQQQVPNQRCWESPSPCSFCLSTSLRPARDVASVGTQGQLGLWSDTVGMLQTKPAPPKFTSAESPADTHGMRLSLIPAFTPSRFCT